VADIHARVDDALLEAARAGTGLPEDATGPRIVRASLATAANWPPEAVEMVARQRGAQQDGDGDAA
jgi:hypothetical protein